MSILNELNNLESSTIYKLKYNGKILGFRVKYYSIESKSFNYYDFELQYVKRQDLRDYLNKSYKDFQSLELINNNGVACTQDEIDGKVSVFEFKDEKSAESILDIVIKIMMENK